MYELDKRDHLIAYGRMMLDKRDHLIGYGRMMLIQVCLA